MYVGMGDYERSGNWDWMYYPPPYGFLAPRPAAPHLPPVIRGGRVIARGLRGLGYATDRAGVPEFDKQLPLVWWAPIPESGWWNLPMGQGTYAPVTPIDEIWDRFFPYLPPSIYNDPAAKARYTEHVKAAFNASLPHPSPFGLPGFVPVATGPAVTQAAASTLTTGGATQEEVFRQAPERALGPAAGTPSSIPESVTVLGRSVPTWLLAAGALAVGAYLFGGKRG